jgi:hypothetical protein
MSKHRSGGRGEESHVCVSRGRHLAGEPHEQMRITQTCSRERKEEKGKHESEEKKLEEQKGLVVGKQNEENKKNLKKDILKKKAIIKKGKKEIAQWRWKRLKSG